MISESRQNTQNAAISLATCALQLPTELGLARVAPRTPMITHQDVTPFQAAPFRAIPISPRVLLHDTPISFPIFAPVITNEYGFLVWRYIGEKPIHTVLKGTIHLLLRHANANAEARVNDVALQLMQFNFPLIEHGQNDGSRHLATTFGGLSNPAEFSAYSPMADYCLPFDQAVVNDAASNPEIWPGSVPGEILSRSTSTDLEPGSGVRTTNWFDVSSLRRRVFMFNFNGTSSRFRVQVRRPDGSIYYDAQSHDATSRRLFRAPPDAGQMRIHYCGPGDRINPGSESIRVVARSTGAAKDPLSGVWSHEHLVVQRDVVFLPQAHYALRVNGRSQNGSSFRDWGYRYLGGGLSFAFNASDIRAKLGSCSYVYSETSSL